MQGTEVTCESPLEMNWGSKSLRMAVYRIRFYIYKFLTFLGQKNCADSRYLISGSCRAGGKPWLNQLLEQSEDHEKDHEPLPFPRKPKPALPLGRGGITLTCRTWSSRAQSSGTEIAAVVHREGGMGTGKRPAWEKSSAGAAGFTSCFSPYCIYPYFIKLPVVWKLFNRTI